MRADELRIPDLEADPVWEYLFDESNDDESNVRPVKKLPVSSLGNRLLGTQVRLHNGKFVWAILENVRLDDPIFTSHFLSLSLWTGKDWFSLARYHDPDFSSRSPDILAAILDTQVGDLFPILYDIRAYCRSGDPSVLQGRVDAVPIRRLSESELIGLAIS
jgi:hypothetical protein